MSVGHGRELELKIAEKQKARDKYVGDFNYSGITWNGPIWN